LKFSETSVIHEFLELFAWKMTETVEVWLWLSEYWVFKWLE